MALGKEPAGKANPSIEKKGGYESGSRPATQLPPPPKGPGAGAKPASTSKK
jgi:hypothetical protein